MIHPDSATVYGQLRNYTPGSRSFSLPSDWTYEGKPVWMNDEQYWTMCSVSVHYCNRCRQNYSGTHRCPADYTFRVELPLPPSLNATYRTNRKGQFYSDVKAKDWKDAAILTLRQAGLRNQSGTFTVVSTLYCDANRDLDSSSKITLDAIATAAGLDDKNCREMVLRKVTAPKAEHRLVLEVVVE